MKKLVFTFTLNLFLVGCSLGGIGTQTVVLGDVCYKIPSRTVDHSALLQFFEKHLTGTDETGNDMLINFTAQETAKGAEGYQMWVPGSDSMYQDGISAVVASLTHKNVEYIKSGVHDKDMWLGTGDYAEKESGRKIEYDPQVGLYRIYRRDFPSSWTFVDIDPNKVHNFPPGSKHEIAGCRRTKRMEKTGYSCLRTMLRGNISVQYWVGEVNFPLYHKIDDFIYGKLEEWRVAALKGGKCPQR